MQPGVDLVPFLSHPIALRARVITAMADGVHLNDHPQALVLARVSPALDQRGRAVASRGVGCDYGRLGDADVAAAIAGYSFMVGDLV